MPESIDRDGVQRLLRKGAQLVEVLPEADYREQHIARAVNLPLRRLTRETAGQLDRGRPVITYCNDFQ